MNKYFLFLCLFLAPLSAWSLIPVVDVKSFFAMIDNIKAVNHFKKMAHEDMSALRSTLNGLNPLHLKSDLLSDHMWSPKTWTAALSGGEGSSIQPLIDHYRSESSSIQALLSSSKETLDAVKKNIGTTVVLESSATASYNQLSSHIQTINELSNQVTQAASTKAALDLNNKLLVELAYLSVDRLRMAALGNQASAITLHNKLRQAAMTNHFLGNEGGDNE